jgi:AcrR family transcriptional regulator
VTTLTDVQEKAGKAEQTRELILSTALRLFREQGYDKATMRAIAAEAGVSVGNAYYYFGSKEHLIQAYYDQMQVLHHAQAAAVLATETTFAGRLAGVFEAWLVTAAPYHEFAGSFFKNAAAPKSPLSPFSDESRPAREASVALFREVVEGSDLKISAELRKELPELLWMLHMGLVLFWVHDDSDDLRRTRGLIAQSVPMVDRLLRLTRIPGVRGIVNDLVELVRTTRR